MAWNALVRKVVRQRYGPDCECGSARPVITPAPRAGQQPVGTSVWAWCLVQVYAQCRPTRRPGSGGTGAGCRRRRCRRGSAAASVRPAGCGDRGVSTAAGGGPGRRDLLAGAVAGHERGRQQGPAPRGRQKRSPGWACLLRRSPTGCNLGSGDCRHVETEAGPCGTRQRPPGTIWSAHRRIVPAEPTAAPAVGSAAAAGAAERGVPRSSSSCKRGCRSCSSAPGKKAGSAGSTGFCSTRPARAAAGTVPSWRVWMRKDGPWGPC